MTYIFSWLTKENNPKVIKSWFGLRQRVVLETVVVSKSVVLNLTDDEVKTLFQGERFPRIIQQIVQGTHYQLEQGSSATPYIPTTNCKTTRAACSGEAASTNECFPSDNLARGK